MDELEFALEHLGGARFEELAMAYLRLEGYDVHESGKSGADGGWDARVTLSGLEGIAHASVRNDWRQKIREDAEKVRELEEETGADFNILVFVTNQSVNGRQEVDMEGEIREEYGWTLKIHHRSNILGEIRTNHPELAEDYLDVDLGTDRDQLEELLELRDDRLKAIKEREGDASDLEEGPTIALHVIPNGIFSQAGRGYTGEVPAPPVFWELVIPHADVRGKASYGYDLGRGDGHAAYGVLRNDGLYETAKSFAVEQEFGDLDLPMSVSRSSPGLDAFVAITIRRALERIREMDFNGSAMVSIALLDAGDLKYKRPVRRAFATGSPTLGVDRYVTDPVFASIDGDRLLADLEPLLDEIWRELGLPNGTGNIEAGEWTGGSVSVSGENLIGGEE